MASSSVRTLALFCSTSVALSASPVLDYPKTCPEKTTLHGQEWPTRYWANNCVVEPTQNATRGAGAVDINIAIISPYVGSIGDAMTVSEPLVEMAAQEIEDSGYLPGYRMKFTLADSRCTGPDATASAIRVMSEGPVKHGIIGDLCSGSCVAISDAVQPFKVMQLTPGCISTGLSNPVRHPFFARMVPSFRYNVIASHELMKYFGWKRIGIIFGPRDITALAKDVLLSLINEELAAGTYDWSVLLSEKVATADQAADTADLILQRDSRIIWTAMYEDEGSLFLCAASQRGMAAPDYAMLGSAGWWNENFVSLWASSTACTDDQIVEAGFGMIATDRGGALNSDLVHGLSGRRTRDIYSDYVAQCSAFAGGQGACNYVFSPYFYDSIWHFALLMHKYLIEEGNSFATLATPASRERLFEISLAQDYQGFTGRVRQFNGVDPATTVEGGSLGDREGEIKLRQLVGGPGQRFNILGYWTPTSLDWLEDVLFSRTDATKKLPCSGSTCDFASGFVPADRSPGCSPGAVWSIALGCERCPAGKYAESGASTCSRCSLGTFNNLTGQSECRQCPRGTAAKLEAAMECSSCEAGAFSDMLGASECQWCPRGRYSNRDGAETCSSCPGGLTTRDVASRMGSDCTCTEGFYQAIDGSCRSCGEGLLCEVGSKESAIPLPGSLNSTEPYPKLEQKYYSSREAPLSVYECLTEAMCPGGAPESCGPHRTGLACGDCEAGYFTDTEGNCHQCADVHTVRALWPTLFIIVMPPVVYGAAVFVGDDVDRWRRPLNAIQSLVFVAFAYTQTIALHAVLKLELPSVMKVSSASLSIFLSPLKVFNTECADFEDFQAGFVARILLPIYCAVICLLACGVGWLVNNIRPNNAVGWWSIMSLFGSFYTTLYLSIASQTFSLFMCYDHPNGKASLRIASDVLCYEDTWNSLVGVAVVAILIFCVGSVAVFVQLLRIAPKHFHNRKFRLSIKFLLNKFRVGYGFWSIVIIVKGLWITLSTVLFTEVVGQIMWLNFGMVIYTLLTATCYPFRAFAVSIVDIGAHAMIFYVYNGSTFFASADQQTMDRVGTTNAVLIFSTYLGFIGAAMWQVRLMFGLSDRERTKAAVAKSEELCVAFKILGSQPERLALVLEHLSIPETMALSTTRHIALRESGQTGGIMEGSVEPRLQWQEGKDTAGKTGLPFQLDI